MNQKTCKDILNTFQEMDCKLAAQIRAYDLNAWMWDRVHNSRSGMRMDCVETPFLRAELIALSS